MHRILEKDDGPFILDAFIYFLYHAAFDWSMPTSDYMIGTMIIV